jgi:hypothetical protein
VLICFAQMSFEQQSIDLIFNYLKSLPMNFITPVILKYNSLSTIFRLLFPLNDRNNEKIVMATNFLNHLTDEHNCICAFLKQYLKTCRSVKMEVKKEPDDVVSTGPDITGERLGNILSEAKTQDEKIGLLVDWLSTIELEIAYSQKQKLQVGRSCVVIAPAQSSVSEGHVVLQGEFVVQASSDVAGLAESQLAEFARHHELPPARRHLGHLFRFRSGFSLCLDSEPQALARSR